MRSGVTSLRRAGSGMLGLWAFAMLAGLLPSLPIAWLVGGVFGDWPDGDLVLAAPGGMMLTELLRLSVRDLAAAVRTAPVWVVVVASLAAFPQAALAAQLAATVRLSFADALSLAVRRASSLLALAAVHLVMRVVLLGVVVFFATMSTVVAKTRPGELVVVGVVLAIGLLLGAALRHILDLALMRMLVDGARVGGALLDAFGANGSFWRAYASVLFASTFGAFTFVVAVVAAHEIGAATSAQACVGAALRSLAILSLVVTRALWLSVAAARVR